MSQELKEKAERLAEAYERKTVAGTAVKARVFLLDAENRKVGSLDVVGAAFDAFVTQVGLEAQVDISDLRTQIDDLDKTPKGRKP